MNTNEVAIIHNLRVTTALLFSDSFTIISTSVIKANHFLLLLLVNERGRKSTDDDLRLSCSSHSSILSLLCSFFSRSFCRRSR